MMTMLHLWHLFTNDMNMNSRGKKGGLKPIKAASRSFLLLVMTLARSASVIKRSGRASGSKTPPAAGR